MRWRKRNHDAVTFTAPQHVWNDVVSAVNALDERDRARDIAVQLEQQNAYLIGFLHYMRDDLKAGGRTLLTIDDLVQAIDLALNDVSTEAA